MIYTIGFTKKKAEEFFGLLKSTGAQKLVDVRLHNRSQLAGFAKKEDLAFFLREICGMEYVHLLELAPTPELLDAYRKRRLTWQQYEDRFLALLRERRVEQSIRREMMDESVLLCAEHEPDRCHRRLVAEYLAEHWEGVVIRHLMRL